MSHTLDMLQQHQQPLQQCAALFSHIQTFLKGVRALLRPLLRTACQAGAALTVMLFTRHSSLQPPTKLELMHLPSMPNVEQRSPHRSLHRGLEDQTAWLGDPCPCCPVRPPAPRLPTPTATLPTAAQESVSACRQDWSSVQTEFMKRFDTQLRQELADHGSCITGAPGPLHVCHVVVC